MFGKSVFGNLLPSIFILFVLKAKVSEEEKENERGGKDGEEGGKEESLGVGNGERLGRGEVKVEEGWRKDGGDEEGNGEVGKG